MMAVALAAVVTVAWVALVGLVWALIYAAGEGDRKT